VSTLGGRIFIAFSHITNFSNHHKLSIICLHSSLHYHGNGSSKPFCWLNVYDINFKFGTQIGYTHMTLIYLVSLNYYLLLNYII